jgi:hypothetical protein
MCAVITGHQKNHIGNIGQSFVKLACICILLSLFRIAHLQGAENDGPRMDNTGDDVNPIFSDEAQKTMMLKDYHYYKIKTPLRRYPLNWLNDNFALDLAKDVRTITESELFEVSMELYSKYYMQRIELYNINQTAFLYLNLREAQTNLGALQFQVNLPNFRNLFKDNPNR